MRVVLIFVNSIPPVFFSRMKALVTSPMPCEKSALVLQRSGLIANPSVVGSGVEVFVDVKVAGAAEPVNVGKGVVLGVSVATEGVGVRLATPRLFLPQAQWGSKSDCLNPVLRLP